MSWTKTSEGLQQKEYLVASETLTTHPDVTTTGSAFSVPAGMDMQIFANSGATNLSASTHAELWVSFDNSTFKKLADLSGSIDNASLLWFYDTSTKGQYPYYKFKIGAGGGEVVMKVSYGKYLNV